MSDKYSKGVIINDKFRGKKIMDRIRKRYENLIKQEKGMSSDEARSSTSTQTKLKKGIADVLKNKSELARKKEYMRMGFTFEDRKKFEKKYFKGGELSKHETNILKKKLERVKNRNVAMSKRQKEEFAAVMSDEELNQSKSQQIKKFREGFKKDENVKSTAEDIGVETRSKNNTGFAGGAGRSVGKSNSASSLGGANPTGLTGGGGGSAPGGGGLLNFK